MYNKKPKTVSREKEAKIIADIFKKLYYVEKVEHTVRCYFCKHKVNKTGDNGLYQFEHEKFNNIIEFYVPGRGCLCDTCISRVQTIVDREFEKELNEEKDAA